MEVAHFIILCGAKVWVEALAINKYRKRLASVQRYAALRIAGTYQSVPKRWSSRLRE